MTPASAPAFWSTLNCSELLWSALAYVTREASGGWALSATQGPDMLAPTESNGLVDSWRRVRMPESTQLLVQQYLSLPGARASPWQQEAFAREWKASTRPDGLLKTAAIPPTYR